MAFNRFEYQKPRKLVLVVDDDDATVKTVAASLREEGYDVVSATDGDAGLALAERERPDLILLDMMLPKRSGFLVLEALRMSDGQPPVPVIMITANEGERHHDYAETLGVEGYLRKPFEMPELLDAVRNVVGE